MITDAIVDFLFGNLMTVLGWLPDSEPPAWIVQADGMLDTVTAYASEMGAWFPSTLLVTVQLAILASWGIGFGIKVVRMVASFFTAGGGSAA